MESKEQAKLYKLKDIKTYASREWLAEGKKRYRTVYEVNELSYIYVECNLINKKIDTEETWKFKGQLKCYEQSGKHLCTIDIEHDVLPSEYIFTFREGWGNETVGSFWYVGAYCWELWSDNEKLGSSNFYVNNLGVFDLPEENPAFYVQSVKLFESNYVAQPRSERTYYCQFTANNSRYIWTEAMLAIMVDVTYELPLEITFNYYTDQNYLKGSIQELFFLPKGETQFEAKVGWGAETSGTWYRGEHRVEVVYLEKVIAVLPFTVDEVSIEAPDDYQYYVPKKGNNLSLPYAQPINADINEVLMELDSMIGLEDVKTKIRQYVTYLQFLKLRKERGIEEKETINLHSVFIGNPGTGKTTVAKLLGNIYRALGLLSKGHVHQVDRSDLVGEFIGQTAPKAKAAIDAASGGILFIDEAYALARTGEDTKDFGREVIEILVKEMSEPNRNFAVIVAGYPAEMKHFLESNPGIKSRFNHTFEFKDFTPQELILIADSASKERGIILSNEARKDFYKYLVEAYRTRDKSFGNARFVQSLLDSAKMNMALRLMEQSNVSELADEEISTVVPSDLHKIYEGKPLRKADIPIDEQLLEESLHQLNQLVGLKSVKYDVDELIKLIRYYHEVGKEFRSEFSLHSVFLGNPGTGKTTVARIISNIFKALGILERGHLVECNRDKLIANFQGQTADKTNQVVESAIGGTLFIDEAYNLVNDTYDSFGREAIATILKRMEDDRGKFVLIMAGYPKNMDAFLKVNPGLKSRFDRTFTFEDYSAEELKRIALDLVQEKELHLQADAQASLFDYLDALLKNKDQNFGNARTVRQTIEKIVRNQHTRLSQIPRDQRTAEMLKTITSDDVKEFDAKSFLKNTLSLGFR